MGAYEHALRYAVERKQFGKPIGGFQLVEELLVRMLGNVTACQAMMLRLAQLQDQGVWKTNMFAGEGIYDGQVPRNGRLCASAPGRNGSCSRTISVVSLPTQRPSIPMKARVR